MYSLAIVGNDCTADITSLACKAAGFSDISRYCPTNLYSQPFAPIPANASRLISALCSVPFEEFAREPQRAQIRLGRSAYLVSELPLGEFYRSHYGAPMLNSSEQELRKALAVPLPKAEPIDAQTLNQIETAHQLTLVTSRLKQRLTDPKEPGPVSWFSVTTPLCEPIKANVTWLNGNQRIFQWSSLEQTHFLLVTPTDQPFATQHWHPVLHDAINNCGAPTFFDPALPRIREYYYDGSRVFLGAGCYQTHPVTPDNIWLGLEDAWVLARMLENYEEDVADGVREYQRYRQARARRADREAARTFTGLMTAGRGRRLLNNVGTALSSRFLPEIVMHRQDWFHQHDCIRGFR
ncbi:MAG: hypothetical protein ACPGXJ_01165 [Pseudomonadales bacterium]